MGFKHSATGSTITLYSVAASLSLTVLCCHDCRKSSLQGVSIWPGNDSQRPHKSDQFKRLTSRQESQTFINYAQFLFLV